MVDIFVSDIDNDSDLDVLSASWDDNKIAWYRNEMDSDPVSIQDSDSQAMPAIHQLKQNYPNPFYPQITIGFYISKAASVRITVYDVTGHLVKILLDNLI